MGMGVVLRVSNNFELSVAGDVYGVSFAKCFGRRVDLKVDGETFMAGLLRLVGCGLGPAGYYHVRSGFFGGGIAELVAAGDGAADFRTVWRSGNGVVMLASVAVCLVVR